MRSYRLYPALALMACGGDWLTGPGAPLELSHQALRGRWVNVLVVHTLVADPSIRYRFEKSPDEGPILEFDGAGGVQHFRYGTDVGFQPQTYTIHGDSLTIGFDYAAEVTTTRLVLTLDSGVAHDFDGDGDEEQAIQVTTHQKAKD